MGIWKAIKKRASKIRDRYKTWKKKRKDNKRHQADELFEKLEAAESRRTSLAKPIVVRQKSILKLSQKIGEAEAAEDMESIIDALIEEALANKKEIVELKLSEEEEAKLYAMIDEVLAEAEKSEAK